MWFVFFLTIFHTYLLLTNQTTHEYLKKIWKNPPINPYSYRNLIKNILSVLFKPKVRYHFDMYRPIDLSLDSYTISPSKEGFRTHIRRVGSLEKMQTDGICSPNYQEREEVKHNSLDEIALPKQV